MYYSDFDDFDDDAGYDERQQVAHERRMAKRCWGTPDCGCPHCSPEDYKPEEEDNENCNN